MFRIKLKNGVLEIKKELIVTVIFDVFAFAYWYSSRKLSAAAMMFPGFLLIGIALFSILSYVNGIHVSREAENAQVSGEEPKFGITKKLILFAALTLVMLLLYKTLGFVISIFVYLLLAMLILGVRNKLVLVLIPVLVDVFVFFVFKTWLEVPLPMGLLSFLK